MASINPLSDIASEPTDASLATADITNKKDSSGRRINDKEMGVRLENPTSEEADKDDSEYPAGARLAAIIVALALAIFLVSLDLTIVATAIPKITDQFNGLSDIA